VSWQGPVLRLPPARAAAREGGQHRHEDEHGKPADRTVAVARLLEPSRHSAEEAAEAWQAYQTRER
jgi:hypothetical protein